MKKISYSIKTTLNEEEYTKGLKEKCASSRSFEIYNPLDEKIRFRRYREGKNFVLVPLTNHRNSARKNHHLKFVESPDGNQIEVSVKTSPLVPLFILIWWTILLFSAVSAVSSRNFFMLPVMGIMALFAAMLMYLCNKKAVEELPAIKQALREIIAEIEVDCGK
ncbi:MAG: hypothetical protein E7051_08190 [Lentisphaerae bacterium]|nr:hypothetical protein [Lentisphaerota bacterium]